MTNGGAANNRPAIQMTVYATYTDYTNTYHGTAIASADFSRLALLASAYLDRLTHDRAAAVVDTDQVALLALACCAVAEVVQADEAGGSGIQSESVGGNSVTYTQNAAATRTVEEKARKAAKLFLGGTGLMYPGLLEDE